MKYLKEKQTKLMYFLFLISTVSQGEITLTRVNTDIIINRETYIVL